MSVTYLVSLLPLLACPLGMSLLMWLMMRGHKDHSGEAMPRPRQTTAPSPTAATAASPDRLTELHTQLQQVEVQQAALTAQLTQLGAVEPQAVVTADTPATTSSSAG